MKLLLLLILSLTTGCVASCGVKACHQGWVQFTCKYPETNKTYQHISVVVSNETTIQSSQKDVWENKERFSLYHDTKNKNLQVAIKHLESRDFGEYEYKFYQSSNSSPDIKEGKLEPELEKCQRTLNLTAYTTAKTTITCDYPGDEHQSRVKFFCRKNKFTCEDILATKSSLKSKWTFTNTSHGLSFSASHLTSEDAGVYCCGVESNNGSYRFSLQQIKLEVIAIVTFQRSPAIGQNFTYWCKYTQNVASLTKFICKGEDPALCQPLTNTREPDMNSRFFMNDDKTAGNITITVREVTANDSGTYWCGVQRDSNQTSNTFFNRLLLTVMFSSETPAASKSLDVELAVIICVSLLLLMLMMFVIVLILIYKRFSRLENIGNGAAAQHIKEDNIYEEVQEYFHNPDSGTATSMICLTVNPPNQPASLHYSTINFQSRPNTASGETVIAKPSSSACKYSAVKFSKCPTSSSVNQLYRPTEEPFYSTVNRPQKKI